MILTHIEASTSTIQPPDPTQQSRRSPTYTEYWSGTLIFGLIHLRSPTFILIRIYASTQVANVNGIRRTVIPTPENRKVGSSASGNRPLSSDRDKTHCVPCPVQLRVGTRLGLEFSDHTP